MALKKLPIGLSDFAELIEKNYYFVDKSMFIKELLDSGAKTTLFPRPRRFGKTLNLSMIRYFFEKTELSRRSLFNGLKIEQHADCMFHQGKYPIIWLSFKDVKAKNWSFCYEKLCKTIGDEFKRHFEVLRPILTELEMQDVQKIIAGTASQSMYEHALLDLSKYLERGHHQKVILLIDEYDAAIHEGFMSGYYDKIINFIRAFLGAGVKDNTALEFSVLTGILRIARESLFSGLNNLEVWTFTSKYYSQQFGLLESEVLEILSCFDLTNQIDSIRQWYDGYQSGPHKIYNPWSIINLVKNEGIEKPYWVNTSDNALVKTLLQQGTSGVKEDLELIVQGKSITKVINENMVMPDIYLDDNALWNFLLMCGYLTFENYRPDPSLEGQFLAELKSPNIEVAYLYSTQIQSWFGGSSDTLQIYQKMLQNLVAGNIDEFCELFSLFSVETISSFDTGGKKPEKFYHGFVLGMLASLRETHEIKSNRESGWGRYDVMVIPKNKALPSIIIEFKTVSSLKKETLKIAAQNALKQIDDRQYETELHSRGITNIIKMGIAFQGKKNLILVG